MRENIKKHNSIVWLFILTAVLLILLILFPRKSEIKDGGSVLYKSGFAGVIYCVEHRHRLTKIDGLGYYEEGTVIKVFSVEIYNDTSINYDNEIGPHSSEAQSIIDEINQL